MIDLRLADDSHSQAVETGAGAYEPAQGLVRFPTRVPASLCRDLWTKKKLS